jgi:hypothetical protein
MTEIISLELAREITGKYRLLDVPPPVAQSRWVNLPSKWMANNKTDWRLFYDPADVFNACQQCEAYTASEMFEILPEGTTVTKTPAGFECRKYLHAYHVWDENLSEALGKMLLRVLDEQIKEKQK